MNPRIGAASLGLAALMLGLGGCARFYWTKPGFNQADWNRDTYECERDMRQSGYFGTGFVGGINAQQFQERCLVAKGYSKVRGQPSAPLTRDSYPGPPPPYAPLTYAPTVPNSNGRQACSGPNKQERIAALQRSLDDGVITKDDFETQSVKIVLEPVFDGCNGHSQ